ncbi:thioesterase [Tannerella sp. oral taxon BU063 isolate Cell 8/11]|uniref:Thioesterase n=1 Tax=Tannerella sp. oral taxon BU063 isolate Cell 8/11 TaxID=1411915 RepID=W2CZA9_9BACT|nr:thioesterase [Tannerella sp. oral taxon BU063 isolate Cell 8/11]
MTSPILQTSKTFDIRFSEVDSMHIVWHGSYALYFEDAREEFGRVFGLSYSSYVENGCYAPLVDLQFSYRQPLRHGERACTVITYRNTPAAKVVFDYAIHRLDEADTLIATGSSTQVFLDLNYQLIWTNPPFYEAWKIRHGQL